MINLRVNGSVVRSKSGKNSDTMEWAGWNVADLVGQTARIEIVDSASGGWGHIEVDQIEFADVPRYRALPEFDRTFDIGTMGLALLEATDADVAEASASSTHSSAGHPRGSVSRKISLEPGQAHVATFVVCWCFPNLVLDGVKDGVGRHYGTRFQTAQAVALYVAAHFDHLATQTRLWHDTWYDSTLPHWFLDRTFAEHVDPGDLDRLPVRATAGSTVGKAWAAAKAPARTSGNTRTPWPGCSPSSTTAARAGRLSAVAFQADGVINHRGESSTVWRWTARPAASCGPTASTRCRPTTRSSRAIWPKIKQAMQCLVSQERRRRHSGRARSTTRSMPTGSARSPGSVRSTWPPPGRARRWPRRWAIRISPNSAKRFCDIGREEHRRELFNGEYFIQIAGGPTSRASDSDNGCEIDQVFGQSWAFQVGLGRMLPDAETRSALVALEIQLHARRRSFRERNQPGRWYAMAGEARADSCVPGRARRDDAGQGAARDATATSTSA